jgi:hypothetical protein
MIQLSQFGTDWRDHWARVRRLYARVLSIGQGLATDRDSALDEMFAFFAACYHLRYWVTGSGYRTKDEVRRFFRRHYELRLCGDLCNGDKHFRLESKRAMYDVTVTTMAAQPIVRSGVPLPREPWPGEQWLIRTANGDEDMFDLADRCVAIWSRFV